MKNATKFIYEPGEHESEKASNSYLMSLIALIAGLPLPIINLIATLIFYLGNILLINNRNSFPSLAKTQR